MINRDIYLSSLLTPISSEIAVGVSVKDTDEYELIRGEIEKMSGVDKATVDWSLVVSQGEKILKTKSKDLNVAAYVAMGQLYLGGFVEYDAIIEGIIDLTSRHWDYLYPDRERARIGAFNWLIHESERYLERFSTKDAEYLNRVYQRWGVLQELLREKLGDKAPSVAGLQTTLEKKRRGLEETRSAPKAASPNDARALIGEIKNDNDLAEALKQQQEILHSISKYLRNKNLKDKGSFIYNRLAVWGGICEPPVAKEGKTGILPPQPSQEQLIQTLRKENKHEQLVRELENGLRRNPWWIVGQKYVYEALQSLGGEYDSARGIVGDELRGFLNKNKTLLELKYANGQPIVDAELKEWLDATIIKSAAAKVAAPVPIAPDDHILIVIETAKGLAQTGSNRDAIEYLDKSIKFEERMRNRLRLELEKLAFVEANGYSEASLTLLEKTYERVCATSVAEWEDDLTKALLVQLLTHYERVFEKNKNFANRYSEKVREYFKKLCELDLNAAINIESRDLVKKLL